MPSAAGTMDADLIIDSAVSAVETIIKAPIGSAFSLKNHMAFNLFGNGGTVLTQKGADRLEAISIF